jgi:prepilin-type N-terminal cleavage/methylation domain-containing protein
VTDQRGLGLAELLVVIAVLGIITVLGTPMLLTYLRASETRAAAQELVTFLNQARQLAIARNTSYRVEFDTAGNRLRFVRTSDDTPWVGPGTDGQGYLRLVNNARITAATANPVFASLGSVTPGATITVQNSQGTSSLSVVVSGAGRIRIQ